MRAAVLSIYLVPIASFRPAVDVTDPHPAPNTTSCDAEALFSSEPLASVCGATPLELAVRLGHVAEARRLLQAPELRQGLAAQFFKVAQVAKHLPHWRAESEDGLDVLRRLVPEVLRPKDELLGDIPYNWLIFYKVKVMALSQELSNETSRHSLQALLGSQGFDSFARNHSMNCILLALILFVFSIMVYVSFRLRAFGWFEMPISMAELLPGAFLPERLTDPDFDPSRQKKQLPYEKILEISQQSVWERCWNHFFLAIFQVYGSWLLLCVRIPPEKDAFDEEYLTEDDEECRLKVRDLCAFRAKTLGSLEVVLRALCFCGLHAWLIAYCGRYQDVLLLDGIYTAYGCLVCVMAASVGDDAATVVAALFGVQHGPRWGRAQCTTRSTTAPRKAKLRRRLRRREQSAERREKPREKDEEKGEGEGEEGKEKEDEKEEKKEEKDEEKEEKPLKEEKVERSEVPITFSERFQRQLLNAGVMHTSHASLLELTVVSICSSFLAVVFLFHLRWMACGNFSRFYQTSATDVVVQAYGWPDSFDRLLALSAEVLLMFFCFERLYDMTLLLHCCVLTLKQRNVALKFLLEHQPPWQLPSLPRATAYCEEVLSCSDFALRLSSARWQLLKRPMEFLVLLAEALLLSALLLLLAPLVALPALDPVPPLTLGLVLASPAAHALLQAQAANAETLRQQRLLQRRADLALQKSTEEEDVAYVQLRNRSRDFASQLHFCGRVLGVAEPVAVLYLALLTTGLAFITQLNFIIL